MISGDHGNHSGPRWDRFSKSMLLDLGVAGEPVRANQVMPDKPTAKYRDLDAPEEYADPYAGGYEASLKAFDERCGRVVAPKEGATSFNEYGSNAPQSEEENEWAPWDSQEDYEQEMLANCIMSERM